MSDKICNPPEPKKPTCDSGLPLEKKDPEVKVRRRCSFFEKEKKTDDNKTDDKKTDDKKTCFFEKEKKSGDKCFTRVHVEEKVPPCKFSFLCPPVTKKDDGCKKGWFCTRCPLPKVDSTDICCVYKPIFKLGLLWIAILRHLLFPISCGSPVVHAKSNHEETNKSRASELPLYANDEVKTENCANESERSVIEETIGCARQELQILISQGKVVKTQIDDFLISTSAKTKGALEYLQAEENMLPRYGAIALGGTAGYILALRKGLLKRIMYSTTGAAAVASLAYPREAKEVAEEALIQAKKYFVIGYHFMNGDEVDIERLERDLHANRKPLSIQERENKRQKQREEWNEYEQKSLPPPQPPECKKAPIPECLPPPPPQCPHGYVPCEPTKEPKYTPKDNCPEGYVPCEPNMPPQYPPPQYPPPQNGQKQHGSWCPVHGRVG